MKKSKIGILIAVLALTIIMTFTLSGCSNTPAHKILKDTWLENEVATYDVARTLDDGTIIKGTQVMTTTRAHTITVTVGDITIDSFQGSTVTIDTALDDGSYLKAKFAFSSVMRPAAIWRESLVKGINGAADTKQAISAKFNGKSYEYSISNNGGEAVTKSIPLKKTWEKAPFFDTMQLYHVGRSGFSAKKGAFNPLSFSVPSYTENKLKTVSISAVNTNAEVKIGEKTYATTQVAMKYVQKFPGEGIPIYAWYDNAATEGAGARMLIKFQEGNMVYTLRSVTA